MAGKRRIEDTVQLNDGHSAPVLGFGVRVLPSRRQIWALIGAQLYLSPPEQSEASVLAALKAGYRHLDTADY